MIEAEYGEWLARGQAHQQAARPIDAMLCYRQALKSNRNAVQAQFQLGEVLRDLGRREEALAAFRMALTWQPQHLSSLLALADLLRRTAPAEAVTHYQRAAALDPRNAAVREGLALSLLASGDSSAFSQLAALVDAGASSFRDWDELSRMLAAAPPSSEKSELLRAIGSRPDFPPSALLLAIAIESAVASTPQDRDRALALFDVAERRAATIDDPEALRRLALAAAAIGPIGLSSTWAQRYAQACAAMHSSPVPLLWPRRTSGSALRVAYLVPRRGRSVVGGAMIDIDAYLRHVATAHARDKFAPAILFVGDAAPDNSRRRASSGYSGRDARRSTWAGDGTGGRRSRLRCVDRSCRHDGSHGAFSCRKAGTHYLELSDAARRACRTADNAHPPAPYHPGQECGIDCRFGPTRGPMDGAPPGNRGRADWLLARRHPGPRRPRPWLRPRWSGFGVPRSPHTRPPTPIRPSPGIARCWPSNPILRRPFICRVCCCAIAPGTPMRDPRLPPR